LAAVLLGSQGAYAAGAIDELKPEDQAKVKNGEQVTITAPGQGSVWPQVWVYQRIDSTPEEAMAVFADYDRQHEYVPDLTYSKVSKRIDKTTCEVGYTLTTHFFLHPHESYTVRDHIASYDGGSSFRMEWKLVSAQQMHDTVGNVRFEPMGTGALVAYYNFITPPSVASSQAPKAVAGVQNTVTQLSGRIQEERTNNRALLEQELSALRDALAP
jgi:hypothetical protein